MAIVAAAALALAAPVARADDRADKIRAAVESVRPSLVAVEVQGHVALERVPGLGEAGRRLVKCEATGVIVGADGLVAFASARLDPAGRAFALLGGRARPEVERITIVTQDGRSRAAELVGRDEQAGLAFARVADAAGLKPIAFKPAKLDLGDEVLVVSLEPRNAGRAPRAELARIASSISKPRALCAVSPAMPRALGGVVIAFPGEGAAGLLVALPEEEEPPTGDPKAKEAKDAIEPETIARALAGWVLPAEDAQKLAQKPPTEARAATPRRARSWLGFKPEILTPELAKAHGLAIDTGVRVAKIFPGGPAAKAGLKVGDVLTRLDGEPIDLDPETPFETLVSDLGVGTKVKLTVFREGKQDDMEAVLGESPRAPEDAPRERIASLGAVARELTFFDRDDQGLAEDAPGVVLLELEPDAAGARAGLRPGDVIEKVDDREVREPAQLREALGEKGERALSVRRAKETLALKLRR
jgi:serine protease Do